MILTEKGLSQLKVIVRRGQNGCARGRWLCLLRQRELAVEHSGLVASRRQFGHPSFSGLKEEPFSRSLCISAG
jgi:hypothetical protein